MHACIAVYQLLNPLAAGGRYILGKWVNNFICRILNVVILHQNGGIRKLYYALASLQ
jgi:hypothetical protein